MAALSVEPPHHMNSEPLPGLPGPHHMNREPDGGLLVEPPTGSYRVMAAFRRAPSPYE